MQNFGLVLYLGLLVVPVDKFLQVVLLRILYDHRRIVGFRDTQRTREEGHHFAVVIEPPQELSSVLANHLVARGYGVHLPETHADCRLCVTVKGELCVRLVRQYLTVSESHLLLVVERAYQRLSYKRRRVLEVFELQSAHHRIEVHGGLPTEISVNKFQHLVVHLLVLLLVELEQKPHDDLRSSVLVCEHQVGEIETVCEYFLLALLL